MCISPTRILNPNFGLKDVGLNYLKDCSSKYLNVPCGHCPECIAVRQMGIVQRLNLEYKFNHLLFVMLSYKNQALPVHTTSKGWKIPYASWKDLQDMFKRLRKRNAFGRGFRYLAVNEFGERGHRPHFHVILILEKFKDDDFFTPTNLRDLVFKEVLSEWKRNVATRVIRKDGKYHKVGDIVPDNVHPRYVNLLEYHRKVTRSQVQSNYTVEYIRPLSLFSTEDAVSFYVSKYVMKADPWVEKLRSAIELNHDDHEFIEIWNLVKPRCRWSHGFGVNGWPWPVLDVDKDTGEMVYKIRTLPDNNAIDFLHESVKMSLSNKSPQYLAENGAVYPLARYYYRFGDIISPDLAERFFEASGRKETEGVVYFDKSPDDIIVVQEQFNKVQCLIHQNSQL